MSAGPDEIQRVQAAYRRRIASSWKIEPGARILEIGCGQGDMTEILAEAVGPDGFIMAVDNADPDYGAPTTLGEATAAIKAGPLGNRIEFCLNFDVLNPEVSFPPADFNLAVLAHSSWYFTSPIQLEETF